MLMDVSTCRHVKDLNKTHYAAWNAQMKRHVTTYRQVKKNTTYSIVYGLALIVTRTFTTPWLLECHFLLLYCKYSIKMQAYKKRRLADLWRTLNKILFTRPSTHQLGNYTTSHSILVSIFPGRLISPRISLSLRRGTGSEIGPRHLSSSASWTNGIELKYAICIHKCILFIIDIQVK